MNQTSFETKICQYNKKYLSGNTMPRKSTGLRLTKSLGSSPRTQSTQTQKFICLSNATKLGH